MQNFRFPRRRPLSHNGADTRASRALRIHGVQNCCSEHATTSLISSIHGLSLYIYSQISYYLEPLSLANNEHDCCHYLTPLLHQTPAT